MAQNLDRLSILNKILSESGAEPLTDAERERNVLPVMDETVEPQATEQEEVEDIEQEQVESSDEPIPEADEAEAVDDKSGDATEDTDRSEQTTDAAEKPSVSKEVRKIIDLKSENKTLRKELEALKSEARKAELIQKHSEKYDDETATEMAERDIREEQRDRRLEYLEFVALNATELNRYPQAITDADHIFGIVKSSGMTVDQVCRGLYGEVEPLDVRRAKAAARGELPKSDSTTVNVTKAVNAATTPNKESRLTTEERSLMAKLIAAGVPNLTEEEMLARRKRLG